MLFLPWQSRLKGVEDDAGEDDGWNQWYGAILATVGAGFVALSSSYWLAGAALLALPDWLPQGFKKLQKKLLISLSSNMVLREKELFRRYYCLMSIPSVPTVLIVLLKGFEITYSPPRLSKTKLIIIMTICSSSNLSLYVSLKWAVRMISSIIPILIKYVGVCGVNCR